MNLDFLDKLLVKSHDGNYTAINSVIVNQFSELVDYEIKLQKCFDDKSNVIVSRGIPELLINIHMDTVAPASGWTKNPYKLTVADDRLYGLGTCDTKSNIFAIFEALRAVQPGNIILLFSVDEESNGIESGVTHFLENYDCHNLKKAVICEPTNNKEYYANLGYYSYYITTEAVAYHSSKSEFHCENAILKMGEIMHPLAANGFNLGKIEGGSAGNVIADYCRMLVSSRTLSGISETTGLIEQIAGKNGKIEPKSLLPAFCNIEELKNMGERCQVLDFWTEAGFFQQKGINSVVYGAGNIAQAHSRDEYVTMSSLQTAIDYFSKLISSENK